jgi:hypothetical protein
VFVNNGLRKRRWIENLNVPYHKCFRVHNTFVVGRMIAVVNDTASFA